MINFYYNILDYKEIHPIRFVMIFILIVSLFLLLLYIVVRITRVVKVKYKSKGSKSVNLKSLKSRATSTKKTTYRPNKGSYFNNKKILYFVILIQLAIILVLLFVVFSSDDNKIENTSISSSKYVFGIDISHYQDKINWNELRTTNHPIEFIFIRATMGVDGLDSQFYYNWEHAKTHDYIRGAYHYYRPNQNSTKQFENFKSVVSIEDGDFIPILDIEKESKFGNDNLREGVLNWLKLAEKEYGVKPMIYTGLTFYKDILEGYVDNYPLWIAAYSGKHRLDDINWMFHQFTEEARIKGVKTTVDANNFRGDIADLEKLLIDKVN